MATSVSQSQVPLAGMPFNASAIVVASFAPRPPRNRRLAPAVSSSERGRGSQYGAAGGSGASGGDGALLAVQLANQAAGFDAEEGAVVVVGAERHLVLARAGHLAGVQQVAERLLGDQREG